MTHRKIVIAITEHHVVEIGDGVSDTDAELFLMRDKINPYVVSNQEAPYDSKPTIYLFRNKQTKDLMVQYLYSRPTNMK